MTPIEAAAQKAVDRMIDFVWLAFLVGLTLGVFLGWLS